MHQQHIPKLLKTFDEVCWICTNGQLLKCCGSIPCYLQLTNRVVICILIFRLDLVKRFADVLQRTQKSKMCLTFRLNTLDNQHPFKANAAHGQFHYEVNLLLYGVKTPCCWVVYIKLLCKFSLWQLN